MEEIAKGIIDLAVTPWNYTFSMMIDLSENVSVSLGDLILAFITFVLILYFTFDMIGFFDEGDE